MIGMGSVVTRSVPPFALAYGSPARVRGANEVGMRRKGIADEDVASIAAAYVQDPSSVVVPPRLAEAFGWYDAQLEELRSGQWSPPGADRAGRAEPFPGASRGEG
jgi:UDP-N-acetylglucosamine acyltransferase